VAGCDGGGTDRALSRATGTLLQRVTSFSLFFPSLVFTFRP
jgi:hypothetical protein